MSPKIWKEIQLSNCVIQIITLEPNRYQDGVDLMHSEFFPNENICLGCDLISNQNACNELGKLTAVIAEDGLSVLAVVKETNQAVGVCFNKLQKLGKPDEPSFFAKYRDDHCKEENCISLMNFMIDLDSRVDLFDHFNIDNLLELTFLGTAQEWGGKGIGHELVRCSLELFREYGPTSNRLAPKYASALATSKFSYKIFHQLGFMDILRREFSDYSYNGKWRYSDKVDLSLHNQGLVLMAKEL